MDKKIDIHAVELVRRIRDQQAELLEGKSNKEIVAFFGKAGAESRKRAHGRGRDAANKRIQPPARKTHRG